MSRRQFGRIRKLPSGNWQARYTDAATGEVIAAPHTFATKADGDRWLSSLATDLQRGTHVDPRRGKITFKEWADEWLEVDLGKRATTRARDRFVIDKHLIPALGALQLAEISPVHVRRVVKDMASTLAPATVRTNYGVLRAILNAAIETDYIARSPCRGVKLPTDSKKQVRFLSPSELHKLADALPCEYRAMVYVAGVLGLRWSEVAGLRVGRLDFFRRTLSVAETIAEVNGKPIRADVKSKAAHRTLTVPKFVLDELAAHLARRGRPDADDYVFVAPGGGPLQAHNFRNRVCGRPWF